jgi:TPR repeat protein
MLKKVVQRDRSERRGEAYVFGYVEPLRDARTKLEAFFSILMAAALGLSGCMLPDRPSHRVQDLTQSASQGNVESAYELGLAYEKGRGVSQNLKKAEQWYRKAAEKGHVEAQNNLGGLYQDGIGVGQNYRESLQWYRLAAEQGHPAAIRNLGYLYDHGLGVAEDKPRAVTLYRQAAEKGDRGAMINLGMLYVEGKGIPKDPVQGYMWLDLARSQSPESLDTQTQWRIQGTLEQLATSMKKEQLQQAKALSKQWTASHPVDRPR